MFKQRKKPPRIPKKELRFPTRVSSPNQLSPHALRWLFVAFVCFLIGILFVLVFWALLVRTNTSFVEVAPNWLLPLLPEPAPVITEIQPVASAEPEPEPVCPPPVPASLEEHLACFELVDLETHFAEIEALF